MPLQRRIEVMANGLPGKMARIVAEGLGNHEKYWLSHFALTGPGMPRCLYTGLKPTIFLVEPENHETILAERAKECKPGELYAIDFCKGEGVALRNAQLYCNRRVPFVMGSTIMGGDAKEAYASIQRMAEQSKTPCVVAPNFDVRLNAWMHGLEAMVKDRPGAFREAHVKLSESHQADKKKKDGTPETSGTMRSMLKGIGALCGKEYAEADITCIRDPAIQTELLKVPEGWIGWHAYHFLKVSDSHDGVEDSEELIFKRHGGECYRKGAMLALDFLTDGKNTKYFNTMTDVLKG